MTDRRLRTFHRGMSVIEIVVVLGIIAMLVGIAAPALSSARLSSRTALSQSNLRQMGLAAHAYANLYGAYPIALQYEKRDGIHTTVSWDWVAAGGEVISPGAIWQFTNDPHHVMQCPQYDGPSNAPGDPHTGYNYSPYIGGEARFSTNPQPSHAKGNLRPHMVRRPDRIAMFGLGGYRAGAQKYMRSPMHNTHSDTPLHLTTIYSGGQAYRYREQTLVAYADGHIAGSREPHKGELATHMLLANFMDYPRNGFLSNDASAYDPLR